MISTLLKPKQIRSFHSVSSVFNAYPVGKNGKPLSAYIKFAKENRKSVLEKNPSLTTTEVAVELGKQWRALSESTKEKLRKEYADAFAAFKK